MVTDFPYIDLFFVAEENWVGITMAPEKIDEGLDQASVLAEMGARQYRRKPAPNLDLLCGQQAFSNRSSR
jgi:hypothetical protein